jgi:hypothetical protein
MARESREVWFKRVERWRESGLSAAEFAAEVGINAGSLRHWGWRVNADRRREAAKRALSEGTLTFVEVAAPPAEPSPVPAAANALPEKLELVLPSGLVVRIPPGFAIEALRRLLAVVS